MANKNVRNDCGLNLIRMEPCEWCTYSGIHLIQRVWAVNIRNVACNGVLCGNDQSVVSGQTINSCLSGLTSDLPRR